MIKNKADTKKMYSDIDFDMENSGFFTDLRQKTGLADETTKEMHSLCNYIDWMRLNKIDLAFSLTEDEL